MARRPRIEAFGFKKGQVLADCYEVLTRLGKGYEGEVYLVRERRTGIERTAKFWFPHRNPRNETARRYAKKLHKLRHCPILIQYTHMDQIEHAGQTVPFLVSDFVEGEILSDFLADQPRKRLTPFQGVHLLYALAVGMEMIHVAGEYHGDLHTENVIVQRFGLGFDLKVLDFYHHGAPSRENRREDLFDMIRIFYDALGGQKHYKKQPPEVKEICCGLKRTLILSRFRNVGRLRLHLEHLSWT